MYGEGGGGAGGGGAGAGGASAGVGAGGASAGGACGAVFVCASGGGSSKQDENHYNQL